MSHVEFVTYGFFFRPDKQIAFGNTDDFPWGFSKGGVSMKWKKVLCTGLFTGLLTVTGMTGFALDLTKETDVISRNPSNVYTMYLGMSDSEFKQNFSGVTGWNYNNSTQTKMWKLPSILEAYDNGQIGIVHTYGRLSLIHI